MLEGGAYYTLMPELTPSLDESLGQNGSIVIGKEPDPVPGRHVRLTAHDGTRKHISHWYQDTAPHHRI